MFYDNENNRDIENIAQICSNIMRYESQYEILQKRLQLLKEYLPSLYSTKFRNPCWYDYLQAPSSENSKQMRLIQEQTRSQVVGTCSIPLFYNSSLATLVVEQAKSSNNRQLHCLPSFFISGFSKSASTTLHRMIAQHPQISEPRCKENHFWGQFVNQQGTDLDKRMQFLQHLNYFSPSIHMIKSNPQTMTLDSSVSYFTSNSESDFCVLPHMLIRVLPQAKFIVIMRNPSERVLSSYFYYLSKHYTSKAEYVKYVASKTALKAFHYHTSDVIMKFQSCVDSGHSIHSCVRNKTIDGKRAEHYVGLQTSMYYYLIVPWLNVFPRERFLFLRTEDLARDKSLTMLKVWNFLNLDPLPQTKEVFAKTNKHAEFPGPTKELLDSFFQPHNELLANLLSDSKYLWKDL